MHEPEPPSALATVASMAAGAAGMAAGIDDEPFKFKDFGGYRAVYTKEGKLADWLTQAFMNADNIGGIIQSAQKAISEARQQGQDQNRLQQMEQELRRMRSREQEMQNRMSSLQYQAQQAQMMPAIDVDSFVDSPPPPLAPPPPPAPAPEEVVVVQPVQQMPVEVVQHVGPVAGAPPQATAEPASDDSSGLLDSMKYAESLLD